MASPECLTVYEEAFGIEVVVDVGVDRGELLQALHPKITPFHRRVYVMIYYHIDSSGDVLIGASPI